MVNEIRIYIEGGGDSNNTKASIRRGFSQFFQELVQLARSKNIKWLLFVEVGIMPSEISKRL